MEDIKRKAHFDELNKSKDEIGSSPRKYIGVPRPVRCIECGRLVDAEYEVTSIDSESSQATAKSPSGIDLIVNTAVDSDAVVTKVEGGVPYTADYYYQLANMRERMKNSTIIDKMVSALSTAATRVQDIPASNTTYRLEESLKSIQQTLDVIYNKFGV